MNLALKEKWLVLRRKVLQTEAMAGAHSGTQVSLVTSSTVKTIDLNR